MKTTNALAPRVAELRSTLRARRTARAAKLHLERDLASYTTPADRLEWDAILARHNDDETAEIRTILNRQHAA